MVHYEVVGRVKIVGRTARNSTGRIALVVGRVDVVFVMADQIARWDITDQKVVYKVGYNTGEWDITDNTGIFKFAQNVGE
jgi:hypothetical protein